MLFVTLSERSPFWLRSARASRLIAAMIFSLGSLLAVFPLSRASAENLTLSVRADSPVGTLPTWYEPSAFTAFTTDAMKMEFQADSVKSRGMFTQTVHYVLGASTSLADYRNRLAATRLAAEAKLIAAAGGQVAVTVSGTPAWISSSSNTAVPPGCTGEWPTFQTVAPASTKWADWQAVIRETVAYYNVTNQLTNVWFVFWPEADGPCFWTDTQERYLQTWESFAAAARSVDPKARLGGPAPGGGPASIKAGQSVPLMQAFIDYSAARNIKIDFVAYHMFEGPPEEAQLRNRAVLSMLSARGLPTVPIVVSSWNPTGACYNDPSWPSPPSALGCWQPDTEMGASYSLSLMRYLSKDGIPGYQTMYALDDANVGGTEEFPHDWGMRTSQKKNGIRKAIYHAQTIVGRMPRSLVTSTLTHAASTAEYFEHVSALAGAEGNKLSVLVWSYVSSPGQQARAVLNHMGYKNSDFLRWGGQNQIGRFVAGQIPVTQLTSVAAEQNNLQTMKNAYYRQVVLVTETNRVTFAVSGFASAMGYQVTRYLIDASHNNAYATYVSSGLPAAIAGQKLQVLDTRQIASLSEVPVVDLKPYSVMLIEIERK